MTITMMMIIINIYYNVQAHYYFLTVVTARRHVIDDATDAPAAASDRRSDGVVEARRGFNHVEWGRFFRMHNIAGRATAAVIVRAGTAPTIIRKTTTRRIPTYRDTYIYIYYNNVYYTIILCYR
jgi:hypothetical protein